MDKNSIFAEAFDDLFSESEWDDWAEGKINLYDLYMEKIGATEEETKSFRKKHEPSNKSNYQDFIDNPVTCPKQEK